MKFDKKKFNIFLATVLALICLTVGFSTVDFDSSINKVGAEEINESINQEQETYSEESKTEEQQPKQETKKVGVTFDNAWTAYNYALEMEKNNKSYQRFIWKVDGNVTNYPITVDFITKRKIYNNLTEIYVENEVETIIDVGNLGFDIGAGRTFVSQNCYDMVNGLNYESPTASHPIADDKRNYKIMTYEIPYVINKNTAKAYIKNDPDKTYYEITMILNSKAWQEYREGLKANIGSVEGMPSISSIEVKIKIDKTYGTFVSFSSTERYSLTYVYGSLKANIEAVGYISVYYDYTKDISNDIHDFRVNMGYEE